jgi:hypothetical protein
MKRHKTILLASHGTEGARAAERLALTQCTKGALLIHFLVVPDFWRGIMGDDWLNNASTQADFEDYLSDTIENEIREHSRRVERAARKRGVRYRIELVSGKPSECLAVRLKRGGVELAVLGSPRPKGMTGFRSRMLTEEMLRKPKKTLILIAPHPT